MSSEKKSQKASRKKKLILPRETIKDLTVPQSKARNLKGASGTQYGTQFNSCYC